MTLQELVVIIAADVKNYSKGIDDAISKGHSAESAFTSIGKTLSATLTVPLAAIGALALKAASDFKEASNTIRIGTGAVGKDLDVLNASFKTVFATVPDSAHTTSEAIAAIATRLGLTGQPLEALSTQMLNLARITKSEIGPLVAATTRAFGDWSIATDKQAGALDFLFKVSQGTGIQITRLSELVVQFGAPMRALGLSFEQGAVLLGRFEKEGVNIETVMPGLRRELGNFAKAGIDAATGFGSIIERIKGAKTEAEGLTIAIKVFGQRAATDMFRAIKEGRFDIDAMTEAFKRSSETINKAEDDTRTLSEEMKIAWHEINIALAPIGEVLRNAMKGAFEVLKPLVGEVGGLGQAFSSLSPHTQSLVVGLAAVVAGIGPAMYAMKAYAATFSPVIALAGMTQAALLGVAGAFSNITFALSTGMVAALTTAETALLAVAASAVELGAPMAAAAYGFDWLGQKAAEGAAKASVGWTALYGLLTTVKMLFPAAFAGIGPDLPTGKEAFVPYGPAKPAAWVAPDLTAPASKAKIGGGAGGLGNLLDKDAIKHQVLSIDQLIKKQAELDAEVQKAQGVFDKMQARYDGTEKSARQLAIAHDQLQKAIDAAAGSAKSQILSVTDLVRKQEFLNAEVQRAEAVLADLQRRKAAGEEVTMALARAEKAYADAVTAANGPLKTAQTLFDQYVADSKEALTSTLAIGGAYLKAAANFAEGSNVANMAYSKMVASFQGGGEVAITAWKQLVAEAGGYTMEVISGSTRTQQAFGLAAEQMRALNEIFAAIQGKAKGVADTMAGGIQKTIQYIEGGTYAVEVFAGHGEKAAKALQDTAGAAAAAVPPAHQLASETALIGYNLDNAATSAFNLGDAIFAAGEAAIRLSLSVVDAFSSLASGFKFTTGAMLNLDLMAAAMAGTPYTTEWRPGVLGGGGLTVHGGPEGTSTISIPVKGAQPEEPEPWRRGWGEAPEAHAATPSSTMPANQEELNAQLAEMIADNLPLAEILQFAGRIGAYVGKSVTDQNTLVLQFTRASGVLDNFITRLPYLGDDIARAVEGAGSIVADTLSAVGSAVSSSVSAIGAAVTAVAEAAASNSQWIAELLMPELAVPLPLAGTPSWVRAMAPAEFETTRPNVTISGNVFRSQEDMDYLVERAKSMF